jgi:small subunit ribosomal protein S3
MLIGRGGEGIGRLKSDIERRVGRLHRRRPAGTSSLEKRELKLSVEEVRSPETDARIVAEQIREDIEKRIRFRRILKQTVDKVAAHAEAKGVKVMLSGRLDGAEMSRVQWSKRGRIPLQTLRSIIDYACVEAHTTYGTIGIKVWIYKGDVFKDENLESRK